MILERIPAGRYAVNCYIVGDKSTSKAAVIDPGGDVDDILKVLEDNNLRLQYILLTHGHGDHIGGVEELREKTSVPVYIHEADLYMARDSGANQSAAMGGPAVEANPDNFMKDGDVLELGELKLNIIHTPGHTEGGVSILVKDVLFTGDTLFANSVGRSDLEGGNQEKLFASIKNKIFTLDEDIKVLPGHGPATTIKIEKATNPFVKQDDLI